MEPDAVDRQGRAGGGGSSILMRRRTSGNRRMELHDKQSSVGTESSVLCEVKTGGGVGNGPKFANPVITVVLFIFGAGVLAVAIEYWFVSVVLLLVAGAIWWYLAIRREQEKAEAQAALRARAAERAHQAELAAAQLRHHLDELSSADPVYSRLTGQLRAVPPTRPADRAEVERAMAERFIIIDRFAHHFAELERTGQPVPDHGETMRGLVEQERAWDSRSQPGRSASVRRPRGIARPT